MQSENPNPLPPLSPSDRTLLNLLLAFDLNLEALARQSKTSILDLLEFASKPNIAAWIDFFKSNARESHLVRAARIQLAAAEALQKVAAASTDPAEIRRANSVLLRAFSRPLCPIARTPRPHSAATPSQTASSQSAPSRAPAATPASPSPTSPPPSPAPPSPATTTSAPTISPIGPIGPISPIPPLAPISPIAPTASLPPAPDTPAEQAAAVISASSSSSSSSTPASVPLDINNPAPDNHFVDADDTDTDDDDFDDEDEDDEDDEDDDEAEDFSQDEAEILHFLSQHPEARALHPDPIIAAGAYMARNLEKFFGIPELNHPLAAAPPVDSS